MNPLCDRSDIAPIRSTADDTITCTTAVQLRKARIDMTAFLSVLFFVFGGGSQGLSRTGTANRLYGGQKATFEGSTPSVSFRGFCHELFPPLFLNFAV